MLGREFGRSGVRSLVSWRRYTGSIAAPVANATFMQPTTFAGDFRQPEQRIGQIGFRFTF
jgi:hypothetical protein